MCGLAGVLDYSAKRDEAGLRAVVSSMADRLAHRGPDDSDVWCDPECGVALGHRRLAVVDLTAAGHQPMRSHDERFFIAYNGELYNTASVRAEVDGVRGPLRWRGHSDTEVLLEAIVTWGAKEALRRVVGMFAFALWDRAERRLTLARDRVGEKPLYYGRFGDALLFGSELKALRAHPAFRAEIDRDALVAYVRHGYVPAPYSIYCSVSKLPPGCLAEFARDSTETRIESFWSARDVAFAGLADPLHSTEAVMVDDLDALLRQAVRGQMEADVPLGAFLSGGIDSSTVVALMQAQSARPINTFTIGFNETEYNEAEHAKAIAAHLGTHHTELYVTPEEARAVIPRLPQIYCEPFADSSQIPTFLVSQLARRHVTVALSGDAGDELFGGYNRYVIAQQVWRKLSAVPAALRTLTAGALRALPATAWDYALKPIRSVLPRPMRTQHPGEKVHKLASVLEKATLDEVYLRLVSLWPDPAVLVPGARAPRTPLTDGGASLQGMVDPLARMSFLDLVTYLPDDILVKVDRAAMAVSLETRVPLLDHRVVEFAWRIPLEYKVRAGRGKHLLRAVLERYVPRQLFERPKMGFGVPIDHWLRGPLREWADHLLDPARLRSQGFFAVEPITRAWTEHREGRASHHYALWTILMFQAWLEHTDGR